MLCRNSVKAMAVVEPIEIVFLDPALKLFDEVSVSDSDISFLSDPFTESDRGALPKKAQDVEGQDIFKCWQFSDAFQRAVGVPKQGTIIRESNREESFVRAALGNVHRKVPLMAQIRIVNLLNDSSICFPSPYATDPQELAEGETFIPDEKRTWEELKDEVFSSRVMLRNIRRMTERERVRQEQVERHQEDDAMSGYWRLLQEYDYFTISPPGFHAYYGKRPHPLEKPPIKPEVLEVSRRKVAQWLAKHF